MFGADQVAFETEKFPQISEVRKKIDVQMSNVCGNGRFKTDEISSKRSEEKISPTDGCAGFEGFWRTLNLCHTRNLSAYFRPIRPLQNCTGGRTRINTFQRKSNQYRARFRRQAQEKVSPEERFGDQCLQKYRQSSPNMSLGTNGVGGGEPDHLS